MKFSLPALGICIVLLLAGCGTGSKVFPAPGPSATLSASPTAITSGQSSTLTWATANATSVTINNGIGTVAASGSTTVTPSQTTTYTLTATEGGGSVTATATVTVSAPPTVTISANPESINAGQSVTLTVSATNATQVVVTNSTDNSSVPLTATGGSLKVTPGKTTTYTATATGSGGTTVTASSTVNVTPATLKSIQHIVFMMQENRTFDSYFGMLNPYRQANGFSVGDDGNTYQVDGIEDKLATISNMNDEGAVFNLFHTSSSCLDDMSSSWTESFGDVNRYDFQTTRPIVMDGFVHTAEGYAKSNNLSDVSGQRAMAYYMDTSVTGAPELNYYYYMASQFALSDRWFSPVASKTIPNRIATMSGGTTQGYVMDPGNDDQAPVLNAKTIFQELSENNITWKIYYQSLGDDGAPATTLSYFTYGQNFIHKDQSGNWVVDSTHIAPLSQYFADLQSGSLPQFAWIEAGADDDEHPGSGISILTGQQQVSTVINSLMNSSAWTSSAFFLAFDEAGGPYDHVPPVPGHTNDFTSPAMTSVEGDVSPIAVNPDGYLPCAPATPGDYTNHCDLRPSMPGTNPADAAAQFGFAAQIGFRVPNFIISPFARRHYVGHNAMDHTAVIRFVEQRFGLAPLTKRDAAQPSLLDFFDFDNSPWLTPPSSLPTPPPVGDTCHSTQLQ